VPSLRSNVLVSTAAMVLVGGLRPGFHAVVNRAFGPEVNGRAATLIAVIFLASLPATAALPTVSVRHISRAIGAADEARVAGFVLLATKAALLLATIGIAAALVHGLASGAGTRELVLAAAGIAGYCWWRIYRTVLLVVGKAVASLKVEIVMFLAVVALLALVVVQGAGEWAVAAWVLGWLAYALLSLPLILLLFRGARLADDDRREFVRFNVLWFIGTASSLAARELMVLFLDADSGAAVVGEISVALSLLTMLAFAPRIIELPLVHELSHLGGKNDPVEQQRVTERALHWLTVFTIAVGGGAAILAEPILAIVGDVHTQVVAIAFVLIAIAFSAEMLVTPATNLIIAESKPSVLTWIGAGSLLVALVWWLSPLGRGALGVVVGLALSHSVKAAALALHAKQKFGLSLYRAPLRKSALLLAAAALIPASLLHRVEPWIAFALFEAMLLSLFQRELRAELR
jgi:O-antigen/teichoic acid export membrane protein